MVHIPPILDKPGESPGRRIRLSFPHPLHHPPVPRTLPKHQPRFPTQPFCQFLAHRPCSSVLPHRLAQDDRARVLVLTPRHKGTKDCRFLTLVSSCLRVRTPSSPAKLSRQQDHTHFIARRCRAPCPNPRLTRLGAATGSQPVTFWV